MQNYYVSLHRFIFTLAIVYLQPTVSALTLQLHTANITFIAYGPRILVTLTNYPQFTRGKRRLI